MNFISKKLLLYNFSFLTFNNFFSDGKDVIVSFCCPIYFFFIKFLPEIVNLVTFAYVKIESFIDGTKLQNEN